jgi:hypothetical protein
VIKALLGLGALALGVVVLVLVQPGEYVVRRQLVMAATPAEVYRIVSDFREWQAWGQLQRVEHTLPAVDAEGLGTVKETPAPASFRWKSEENFGAGQLSLVEAKPLERVRVKIEMEQPEASEGEMLFRLVPDGYEVTLEWSITMQNSLAGKARYLVSDHGEKVGAEMEACLKRIKEISEKWTKFRRQNKTQK